MPASAQGLRRDERVGGLFALVAAAALLVGVPAAAAEPLSLRSPDGQVEIALSADAAAAPSYTVSFHGRQVIAPSALGLQFEAYRKLGPGMAVQSARPTSGRDRYQLVAAKTRRVDQPYNAMTVDLAEPGADGRRLQVILRAYDDGVAFRYRIPAQPKLASLRLFNELTEFALPHDEDCFALNLGRFGSSHEGEFDRVRASSFRVHNLFELPVVCRDEAAGASFALAEADLHDYPGLYLAGRETGDLGLAAKLSPRLDDPAVALKTDLPAEGLLTPWRLVMLASTPGGLMESALVTNLNRPPQGDFSWVKPGKTAWDWWNGPTLKAVPKAGMNDATLRAFIDFAARSGLEYMLIDDGWYVNSGGGGTVYPGADNLKPIASLHLQQLIDEAAQRKVGVWLWVNWKLLDANMDVALPLYARMGVKGIKVDFMDRDDQQMVNYYDRLLRTAAANHLMVDLHGAYHPTGAIRTWPNFLTQEGVMGAEYNKWTRRITATHNTTLPFTRGLLGPYDYTPGGFRNATPATFRIEPSTPMVQTTRGQALAMYVVFDSPFMGVSDSPDNYRDQGGFEFVRDVPSAWDETRVLSGDIGQSVVAARRKDRAWYIGAMTNEQARTVAAPLAFLGPGRFTATIWRDGAAPTEVVKERRTVSAADTLTLDLAASGGAAVKLEPVR